MMHPVNFWSDLKEINADMPIDTTPDGDMGIFRSRVVNEISRPKLIDGLFLPEVVIQIWAEVGVVLR